MPPILSPAGVRTAMEVDCDRHIGAKLRELRIKREMTQQQLAEIVGITFQQIQKYESGANRIGGSRLWCIAEALGVSPVEFFPPSGGPHAAIDGRLPTAAAMRLAQRITALPTDVRKALDTLARHAG